MDRAGQSALQIAMPTAISPKFEYLFYVSAGQDRGFERPWMIMRMGMRLWARKSVQGAVVIQMIFHESARHPLGTDNRGSDWRKIVGNLGNSLGHVPSFANVQRGGNPQRF